MKHIHIIALFIIAAVLSSCASGSRTNLDGTTTKYCLLGTDAQSVVIDGDAPVVTGYQPVYKKDGVTIDHMQPLFGAPVATARPPLFAAYGLNQSKGLAKVCSVITNSVASVVAGAVVRHIDDNKTSIDAANSANAAQATTQANALTAQKQANDHAMGMAKLEPPAP
jgi:hypothetical protein